MTSDGDRKVVFPIPDGERLPGRLWSYGDFDAPEEHASVEPAGGLVSLGYLRAAVRRSAVLCFSLALVGLLVGLGAFKARPPADSASTSLLLTLPANALPGAIADDAAMAQSSTVAGMALKQLGIPGNPGSLVANSIVTGVTDRVLLITVKASSTDLAVREANALGAAFLVFQANLLKAQEKVDNASLRQTLSQAEQNLSSLSKQISKLRSQGTSAAEQSQLSTLQHQYSQDADALPNLKQAVTSNESTNEISTATVIKGSMVLDPAAPLPSHRKKYLLLYAGGGLIAGLVIALAIVLLRALTSSRLRQRDDIAATLRVPVRLSVGKIKANRWLPGQHVPASPRLQRIVAYLDSAVPATSRGPASMAVVPTDDVRVAAACLVSLALSRAEQGSRVVLADLCDGFPAARLLGVTGAGLAPVTTHGARLFVYVPEQGSLPPSGPLTHSSSSKALAEDPLAGATASADLLLTLAELDPAVGADHLSSWATDVVVLVTTGKPTAVRVQAVGDMIRLARMSRVSAVLVGADKTDETLGMPTLEKRNADVAAEGWLDSEPNGFFVEADGRARGVTSDDR